MTSFILHPKHSLLASLFLPIQHQFRRSDLQETFVFDIDKCNLEILITSKGWKRFAGRHLLKGLFEYSAGFNSLNEENITQTHLAEDFSVTPCLRGKMKKILTQQ